VRPDRPTSSAVNELVEALAVLEALEHLPVAGGVGAPSFDDVRPVLAAGARRVDELPAARERVGQCVSQLCGFVAAQVVGLVADGEQQVAPVGFDGRAWATVGGFLDQEPGNSVSLRLDVRQPAVKSLVVVQVSPASPRGQCGPRSDRRGERLERRGQRHPRLERRWR